MTRGNASTSNLLYSFLLSISVARVIFPILLVVLSVGQHVTDQNCLVNIEDLSYEPKIVPANVESSRSFPARADCSAVGHEPAAHNRTMKMGTITSKPATFEVQA